MRRKSLSFLLNQAASFFSVDCAIEWDAGGGVGVGGGGSATAVWHGPDFKCFEIIRKCASVPSDFGIRCNFGGAILPECFAFIFDVPIILIGISGGGVSVEFCGCSCVAVSSVSCRQFYKKEKLFFKKKISPQV